MRSKIPTFFLMTIFIFPLTAFSESETSSNLKMTTLSNAVNKAWNEKITPLTAVVGKQWASLLTSTSVNSNELGQAVKKTWNKALAASQADEEITNAGVVIGDFIVNEIKSTQQSASNSAQLINEGQLINGIWHLSSHLVQDTDDNLAKAVQESKLINTLAEITATTYGGPQGTAAYASWYAYKETKDPAMALKVGILSGANNAGFNTLSNEPASLSQQLKNSIVTGVMAGLSAAVGGGDALQVKDAFLKATEIGIIQNLSIINAKKPPIMEEQKQEKPEKIEPPIEITTF